MHARCSLPPLNLPLFILLAALAGKSGTPTDRRPITAAPADTTAYGRWYGALRALQPDSTRGATVHNLVLRRDVATIELTQGELHLLQPIEGRVIGAVFVGQGRFSLTPPVAFERAQLRRIGLADSVVTDIKAAVLFFTDETVKQLSATLQWTQRPAPATARRAIEDALKYLGDDKGWMHRDLMLPMLNAGAGFFHAHLDQVRGDPFMLTINPYDFEEVSLSRRAKGPGSEREVITQFHQQSDYQTGKSRPQEALDLILVSKYDIESTIKSNLAFSAAATMWVKRLVPDHFWIPWHLYYELEVDSVRWAGGEAAAFARPEKSGDLWIDVSAAPSDSGALTVYYHGPLLDQFRDLWVEVKSSTTFYPVYEYWRLATYRLTFHVPDKFRLVSVGKEESRTTEGKVATTVWQTPLVKQVTFNLGEFDDRKVEDPRIPVLRVQVATMAHRSLGGMMAERDRYLPEQRDMEGQVTADIANSMAFFNQVYGPTPVREFIATEIPYAHGEAFPGVVLLSWATFQWTDKKGYDEMFRAHEVAHQWWGVGVQPATYHDRWIGEGFAEFSGLWYMGRIRGSVKLFTDRLKETRVEILSRRDEGAPIWLGTRAGSSEHPEDYRIAVYSKGAWVLHMLRNLLASDEDGADDRFVKLMNEFYLENFGGAATTEQFQRTVEKHVGASMGWFFDQWVYGSAIPTYRFSYKLDPLDGGKYRATVRVRQERVPDDFQMVVPVLIDFGPEGTAQVRINVKGPLTEQVLPVLPMKPVRLEFNPFESVLADTKTEGWR